MSERLYFLPSSPHKKTGPFTTFGHLVLGDPGDRLSMGTKQDR